MSDTSPPRVDLSGIHHEVDKLKPNRADANTPATYTACQGFEVIRQQIEVVAAAALQRVSVQVAHEVQMEQLMGQLGGLQGKLSEDPRLRELMAHMFERLQDELGGPERFQRMFGGTGGLGGMSPDGNDVAPDDRPIPPGDRPSRQKERPTAPFDRPTSPKE